MKKRTSFALICVLLFSLLLTTSCNLFHPQIQSTTPESTATETPSDTAEPDTVTVADYEDVISIYRMAVEHLGKYYNLYPQEFADDMYATEITNATDEVKNIYQSIFMPCFYLYMHEFGEKYQSHGINAFGYTVFDINNNGTDELVLMSDECDLIAIFAMVDNKVTLVFNDPKDMMYFISTDGSLKCRYQEYIGTDQLYHYFERTYTWQNDDTLVDAGAIAKEEPLDAHLHRAGELAITKQNIPSPFVRLMGPLTLQKPGIMTWEWGDNIYRDRYNVGVEIGGDFTQSRVQLNVLIKGTDDISVRDAKREGDVVYFEDEKAGGRIEFNAQSVWVIVDKSKDGSFPTGAWLLEYVSYIKG